MPGREEARADEHADLFRQVFEQSHDAIVVFDPSQDELVDANEQACQLFDYDRETLLTRSPRDLHPDRDTFESFVEDVRSAGERSTTSLGCRTREGGRIPAEISASVVRYDGRDCVLAIIRETRDRQRYLEQLEGLHAVGQTLMTVESKAEVAETLVDTAVRLLDQPLTVVWLADEEGEQLQPVTLSGQARELVDDGVPVIEPGTVEWAAFEAGKTRIVDYDDVPNPAAPEAPLRRTMFVPLGDHGLLSVGATASDPFGDETVHLVEVLAQTAAAAFEHVEREGALRERSADLARQNDRLEEFASVVSHDLRNPLNVAQGFLEMVDTEDTEVIERIERALDRMESLIEDVLALARQGETVDELEDVSLATVTRQCWDTVIADGTTLELAPGSDRFVRADPGRLRQVLENLFRNAVEHGGADAVRVGVVDRPDGAGFYVEDDGAGIPEGVRDRLFEAGVSTADDGTGFGLRIVQSIVEAHGWDVSLTESDDGARFEVTGVEWVGTG